MSDLDASETGAIPAWRERKNLLLAGAVGVAILLLAGYFVISGGSSDEDFGPVPSAAARGGGAGASGTATAVPSPTTTLPDESNDDVFNDPFAPIYPAKATAAAVATADTAGGTDIGNGATTTGGTTVTVPTVAPPVTTPSTPKPAPTQKKTMTLQLVKVLDELTAEVRVNGGPTQAVKVGTSFGSYFAITGTLPGENTASFTYGSVEFDLRKGETRKFS